MARNDTKIGTQNNIVVPDTSISPYCGTDTDLSDIVSTTNTATGVTVKQYPRGFGFDLVFTFASAVISHVDGAGSGSHGTIQLGNFNSNWDHLLIDGAALAFDTITSETDAAMVIDWGVGTTAIAAAAAGDVAGTATQVDLLTNSTATTLSSNTLADVTRLHDSDFEVIDLAGTTAIHLNESATAASSSADQDLTISGRYILRVTPLIYVA